MTPDELVTRIRDRLGINPTEHGDVDRRLERQKAQIDRIERVAGEQEQLAKVLRGTVKGMRATPKHR